MLFYRSPFKVFSRVLVNGIFEIPRPENLNPPPPYLFLLDNTGDYLLDNAGDYVIAQE